MELVQWDLTFLGSLATDCVKQIAEMCMEWDVTVRRLPVAWIQRAFFISRHGGSPFRFCTLGSVSHRTNDLHFYFVTVSPWRRLSIWLGTIPANSRDNDANSHYLERWDSFWRCRQFKYCVQMNKDGVNDVTERFIHATGS